MRQRTANQQKRKKELDKIYYQNNKDKINQLNVENHRKPEIVEYIRNFQQRQCTCLVCEKEMNYNSFIRHRVSKKHNSNYMNYNQSQPIMIIQA